MWRWGVAGREGVRRETGSRLPFKAHQEAPGDSSLNCHLLHSAPLTSYGWAGGGQSATCSPLSPQISLGSRLQMAPSPPASCHSGV